MSFFRNIFGSKKPSAPSAQEFSQAVIEALEESRKKRRAEDERSPKGRKQKEPKKRRVEVSAEAPEAKAKPTAEQEPVLLSSKPEPAVLSLLTEREVACLSSEETKRKQDEADALLRTLVMNRVRLEQQNSLQQALVSRADKLLGALSGVATKRKPKSTATEQAADGPPRVTCAAMTTKGRRCRRNPVQGSNKCTRHNGEVIRTEVQRPMAAPASRPAPSKQTPSKPATSRPATSAPSSSKPSTSKPSTSRPATSKPAPPSRYSDSEEEDEDWDGSDIDE